MTETRFRLRIDDDADFQAAQSAQQDAGEPTFEVVGGDSDEFAPQIEPVSAILIGTAVAAAAKFVVDWWERRKGGLVIDQRANATDDLYRDPDVPYGYIVVFPVDGGSVKIETRDAPKDSIQQLLESVLGGTAKTPHDVSKLAENSLGKDAVLEAPADG